MAKLACGFVLFVLANLCSCLFYPSIRGLNYFVVLSFCYRVISCLNYVLQLKQSIFNLT